MKCSIVKCLTLIGILFFGLLAIAVCQTTTPTPTSQPTDTPPPIVGNYLQWAFRDGGSSEDYAKSIAALSDGSFLVTGYSGPYGGVFVKKYSSNGQRFMFSKITPTTNVVSYNRGNSIVALADGSSLVTGDFQGTVTFWPNQKGLAPLTSSGTSDIFIAKYNEVGIIEWIKKAGGSYDDTGHSIIAFQDGSFIVTGKFQETATFGFGESNQTTLTSNDFDATFLAKYNADGSLAWAKKIDVAYDYYYSYSITANSDNTFLITGGFSNTAIFGSGESNQTILISTSYSDTYIAKFNSDGSLVWAKQTVGASDAFNQGNSIATLSDGSSLVTGRFSGMITFGAGESNQTILTTPTDSTGIFLAKYNPDGTLEWAKNAFGDFFSSENSLSVLSDGSSIITGDFAGTITFGSGEDNQTTLTTTHYKSIFMAKYNADGTFAWAYKINGKVTECRSFIATTLDNSILMTGYFYGGSSKSMIFGLGETNETTLISSGPSDIFIAKFSLDSTPPSVPTNISGTAVSGTQINLSWSASTDDFGGVGYKIYRDGELIGTSFTTSYSDTGLAEGTIYSYAVSAYDASNNESDQSLPEDVMTLDSTAPSVPTNISGTAISGNQINLNWSASTDNVGVTGYKIYRNGIQTGVSASTTFNDTGLTQSTTYSYTVSAYDAANNESAQSSPAVDITTLNTDISSTSTEILQWVKRAGGSSDNFDQGNSIVALLDGSSLVTGYFEGTATFGSGETNETILTSLGSNDIFIAKYNADNTLAWAKKAGSASDDQGNSIAAYADGSFVVTGYFSGFATFGSGESNETILTSSGNNDIFIAKYNANGTLLWVKKAGGADCYGKGMSVAAFSDGSSIVTGYFTGTSTFGAGETNETTITFNGDIFVAKYNPNGTLLWVKKVSADGADYGNGITALSNGSSLVTGYFAGTAIFGSGESNETALISAGWNDIFIAKYNSDGTLAWAKQAGGDNSDQANAVTACLDGSFLITGYFGLSLEEGDHTATFGSGEINQTILTSNHIFDTFIAKYNSDGTLAWAKQAVGTFGNKGNSISAFPDGSSLITGDFGGSVTFGSGESNQITLTSSGSGGQIFIAKYNLNGSLAWARKENSDTVIGKSISVISDGSAVVTGNFCGATTFGAGETNETTLNATGYSDIFVAKYLPSQQVQSPTPPPSGVPVELRDFEAN